jgi:ferredoxin-thioredoxin reductase catalytic chain
LTETKKLRELMKKYAEFQGFKLNPDEEVVNFVIKGLFENETRRGYRYCPCRVVTGDRQKDAKIICHCVYRKDEIERMRQCNCGFFVAKDYRTID